MPLDVTDTELSQQVRDIATRLASLEGPLLPILHEVQDSYGHVPQDAVPVIADVLNLTAAEVHGVMSFYHDFRKVPAGRTVVRICRAEACKAMGADGLSAEMMTALGVGWGETTSGGNATLEPIYCLGLCACAPAAMVGGKLIGRANAERIARAIAEDQA